jgi:hypothetical protein
MKADGKQRFVRHCFHAGLGSEDGGKMFRFEK